MSKNSVTGRFRDIEIAFSVEGPRAYMSVRNLISDERQVRVMYQKLAMSGLANWRQFQLTNAPVLLRLPTEVLEAYRLTFFVDNAEPISTRVEKILAELDQLRLTLPPEDLVEDPVSAAGTSALKNYSSIDAHTQLESEISTPSQVEKVVVPRKSKPEEQLEKVATPHAPEPIAEAVIPSYTEADTAAPKQLVLSEKEQKPIEESAPVLLRLYVLCLSHR